MRPFDRCAEEYARHGEDFSGAVARNLADGFLFSTPSFFIMGRPHERPNTWFIEGMAGDMSRAWSILPYELPFVSFQRFDNSLRFIPIERLRRLSKHEMAVPYHTG